MLCLLHLGLLLALLLLTGLGLGLLLHLLLALSLFLGALLLCLLHLGWLALLWFARLGLLLHLLLAPGLLLGSLLLHLLLGFFRHGGLHQRGLRLAAWSGRMVLAALVAQLHEGIAVGRMGHGRCCRRLALAKAWAPLRHGCERSLLLLLVPGMAAGCQCGGTDGGSGRACGKGAWLQPVLWHEGSRRLLLHGQRRLRGRRDGSVLIDVVYIGVVRAADVLHHGVRLRDVGGVVVDHGRARLRRRGAVAIAPRPVMVAPVHVP